MGHVRSILDNIGQQQSIRENGFYILLGSGFIFFATELDKNDLNLTFRLGVLGFEVRIEVRTFDVFYYK